MVIEQITPAKCLNSSYLTLLFSYLKGSLGHKKKYCESKGGDFRFCSYPNERI